MMTAAESPDRSFVHKQDGVQPCLTGGGFLKHKWFLPSPPHSFSKEHFKWGCTSLQGGKRIEGVKNIEK
jgi:hypothetical protein